MFNSEKIDQKKRQRETFETEDSAKAYAIVMSEKDEMAFSRKKIFAGIDDYRPANGKNGARPPRKRRLKKSKHLADGWENEFHRRALLCR